MAQGLALMGLGPRADRDSSAKENGQYNGNFQKKVK